jgi:Fe-S cluster assembly protein SufD
MMKACIEFYQSQAREGMSQHPWLLQQQEQALTQLEAIGFPTRHDEDWKYTSLDSFLQHRFVAPGEAPQTDKPSLSDTPIDAYRLFIVDGTLKTPPQLPSGIVVLSFNDALATMPEKIKPLLDKPTQLPQAFHALNTAMLTQGLYIEVSENARLDKPLWLTHCQTHENQAVHLRHLVVAGKNSNASIIEEYIGDDTLCYYTNVLTDVQLAEGASLTHYKIQRESKRAFHVGQYTAAQASHSQFASHVFSLGGQWARHDLHISLDEPYAECFMNGMYLPFDGQHMDHHTLVQHQVSSCKSHQDYKGILSGHARGVFNGRVVVAKNAQHTEAKQQNKNILLTAHAEIDTKPQLEIFADDVVCTHGATVGQLDEDALFYLATRGIPREEASRYLLKAFMIENLRAIPNEMLSTWIGELLNEQIG